MPDPGSTSRIRAIGQQVSERVQAISERLCPLPDEVGPGYLVEAEQRLSRLHGHLMPPADRLDDHAESRAGGQEHRPAVPRVGAAATSRLRSLEWVLGGGRLLIILAVPLLVLLPAHELPTSALFVLAAGVVLELLALRQAHAQRAVTPEEVVATGLFQVLLCMGVSLAHLFSGITYVGPQQVAAWYGILALVLLTCAALVAWPQIRAWFTRDGEGGDGADRARAAPPILTAFQIVTPRILRALGVTALFIHLVLGES